jgi:Protein of unknown function (DUF1826)
VTSMAFQTATAGDTGPLRDRGSPAHTVRRPSRTALTHILRPGINLAIWQRSVPAAIANWIKTGALNGRPLLSSDLDLRIPAACVPAALATAIDRPSTSDREGLSALVSDVGDLAKILVRITGQPYVRVRLEWVTDQQCSCFHADRVPCRLVCTYRGDGTEWLANETAAKLTSPESEPPASEVHRLASGEVAIMRGSLSVADGTPALMHRSPPVASASHARFFLAIDPIASSKPAR